VSANYVLYSFLFCISAVICYGYIPILSSYIDLTNKESYAKSRESKDTKRKNNKLFTEDAFSILEKEEEKYLSQEDI
jgi:hypothetical protein